MVDLVGESECRHSFHIFRPPLLELGQRLRRRRRPQLLASFKVPEQQRFMAGPLPDYFRGSSGLSVGNN